MSTEQRLQANHPLMREWTAYKQTEEYANSRKWAQQEAHVDGSMWAAFMAGWMAHESYADASEAEKAQAASAQSLFFSYDPEVGGFDTHETAEQARDAADESIAGYRENAHEGWAEEVEQVCWGVVIGRATAVDMGPAPEGSEFDRYVNYEVQQLPAATAAPVAAPLTDELTGKLMRIHAALGKMGKKYGEIGSRDVDVARWNADLYEAIAAVGGVLADQPLEQLARIKLEGGQG